MSSLNNRNTLEHYAGSVWLTKPKLFNSENPQRQSINVCIANGGSFAAVDYLELFPDGIYYRKGKPIGRLDDNSFRKYIEKLAGVNIETEEKLFSNVSESYKKLGDIANTAKNLGLPKAKVQRILISEGLYTNDLISQIAWLYDGGKGKSVKDIADILNISESTVLKNMPYKK